MARKDDLKDVIAKAQDLINAPSCYVDLKQKAQVWINSIGTADEAVAAKSLIDEIKADITGIDGLVAFANSDHAIEVFGKEGAKNFAAHAKELKTNGAQYCDCQACAAGLDILEQKDRILI